MRVIGLAALATAALAIPDTKVSSSLIDRRAQPRDLPIEAQLRRRVSAAPASQFPQLYRRNVVTEIHNTKLLMKEVEKHKARWAKEGVSYGARERDGKLMFDHLMGKLNKDGLKNKAQIQERVAGLVQQVEGTRAQVAQRAKEQRMKEFKPHALDREKYKYMSMKVDPHHRAEQAAIPAY